MLQFSEIFGFPPDSGGLEMELQKQIASAKATFALKFVTFFRRCRATAQNHLVVGEKHFGRLFRENQVLSLMEKLAVLYFGTNPISHS